MTRQTHRICSSRFMGIPRMECTIICSSTFQLSGQNSKTSKIFRIPQKTSAPAQKYWNTSENTLDAMMLSDTFSSEPW
jgi:hypothetical protein